MACLHWVPIGSTRLKADIPLWGFYAWRLWFEHETCLTQTTPDSAIWNKPVNAITALLHASLLSFFRSFMRAFYPEVAGRLATSLGWPRTLGKSCHGDEIDSDHHPRGIRPQGDHPKVQKRICMTSGRDGGWRRDLWRGRRKSLAESSGRREHRADSGDRCLQFEYGASSLVTSTDGLRITYVDGSQALIIYTNPTLLFMQQALSLEFGHDPAQVFLGHAEVVRQFLPAERERNPLPIWIISTPARQKSKYAKFRTGRQQ